MAVARGLVLDANILIRLVLGTRVRELVLNSLDEVVFFTPSECFDDARKYLPDLLAKRSVDPASALRVLDHFEQLIRTLDESVYAVARDEAVARIGNRDVRDWPILAVALILGCPIWTEDHDFFGTGVPTWTTDRVEIYLKASPSR
jgi:predicted nucleic acid-binding protein